MIAADSLGLNCGSSPPSSKALIVLLGGLRRTASGSGLCLWDARESLLILFLKVMGSPRKLHRASAHSGIFGMGDNASAILVRCTRTAIRSSNCPFLNRSYMGWSPGAQARQAAAGNRARMARQLLVALETLCRRAMHALLRGPGLTTRSRRGPTSKRQARAAAQAIIHRAGLAFCCRSHLSSNVSPHTRDFCVGPRERSLRWRQPERNQSES